jgi:hypothetical protein
MIGSAEWWDLDSAQHSRTHFEVSVKNVPAVKISHSLRSLMDESEFVDMRASFAPEVGEDVTISHCP